LNSLESTILYSYLIVIILLYILITIVSFWKSIKENKLQKQKKKIKDQIKKQEIFSLKELKKTNFFLLFAKSLEEEKVEESYLKNYQPIFPSLTKKFQKKDLGFQNYYLSFLKKYPFLYEKEETMLNYIKKSCSSSSIHLRENALRAILETKEKEEIKDALLTLNKREKVHPKKLLTENFLRYKGEMEELKTLLLEIFPGLKEDYKVACIQFFAYQELDCREFLYEILKTKKETKEVLLAGIRYFKKVKEEKVIPILYSFIEKEEDWEYKALSASTLKIYPSKKTIEVLQIALQDPNWYVRNNAAETLVNIVDKKELKNLLEIEDFYIKRALKYQIQKQGKVV